MNIQGEAQSLWISLIPKPWRGELRKSSDKRLNWDTFSLFLLLMIIFPVWVATIFKEQGPYFFLLFQQPDLKHDVSAPRFSLVLMRPRSWAWSLSRQLVNLKRKLRPHLLPQAVRSQFLTQGDARGHVAEITDWSTCRNSRRVAYVLTFCSPAFGKPH